MATALVWLLTSAVRTQTPTSAPLAGVTRLDCLFTASASATWVAGEPRVEVARGMAFRFQIEDIDTNAGSAVVRLGAASTAIVARAAGPNVHFIDHRSEGSMAMTTVLAGGGRATMFRAIHSRTDYRAYDGPGFASVPQAEQLYGYCQAVP